jgi:hypothetical protein
VLGSSIAADAAGHARAKAVKRLSLAVLAALLSFHTAGAQTRFTYSSGQSVSPAYEGWMPNEDGSFTLYFGYMNTSNEDVDRYARIRELSVVPAVYDS